MENAAGRELLSRAADFPRIAREAISEATVLRVSAQPGSMPALVEQLTATAQRAQIQSAILVRPYGQIYFALVPSRVDVRTVTQIISAADNSFRVAAENNARAFIELAPTEIKRRVNPWGPEREDLELMRRVKHVFDPENILSPGRFAGGI